MAQFQRRSRLLELLQEFTINPNLEQRQTLYNEKCRAVIKAIE